MFRKFNGTDIDRIIEMAWEDRTPFEAIEYQSGIKENEVRKIMRENLKRSSFERWRKRVKGRKLSPYQMRLEERKEAMRAKARKRHAEFKAARAAKRKK